MRLPARSRSRVGSASGAELFASNRAFCFDPLSQLRLRASQPPRQIMPLIQALWKDYLPSEYIGFDMRRYHPWLALENAAGPLLASKIMTRLAVSVANKSNPGLSSALAAVTTSPCPPFCFFRSPRGTEVVLDTMQSACLVRLVWNIGAIAARTRSNHRSLDQRGARTSLLQIFSL